MPGRADVLQGTMDLLILKALSIGPMHGWGIGERIRAMSQDVFQIGQGSLYPALHRLELRDWIASAWQTTEHNRIARVYELTPTGERRLTEEVESWQRYAGAVQRVLGAR